MTQQTMKKHVNSLLTYSPLIMRKSMYSGVYDLFEVPRGFADIDNLDIALYRIQLTNNTYQVITLGSFGYLDNNIGEYSSLDDAINRVDQHFRMTSSGFTFL